VKLQAACERLRARIGEAWDADDSFGSEAVLASPLGEAVSVFHAEKPAAMERLAVAVAHESLRMVPPPFAHRMVHCDRQLRLSAKLRFELETRPAESVARIPSVEWSGDEGSHCVMIILVSARDSCKHAIRYLAKAELPDAIFAVASASNSAEHVGQSIDGRPFYEHFREWLLAKAIPAAFG